MSRQYQTPQQIIRAIILQLAHWPLTPRQNHRLTQILQQKAQRTRTIRHRVRAMQDYKAIERVVVTPDQADDFKPDAGVDGAAVEEGCEFVDAVADAPAVFAQRGGESFVRDWCRAVGGDDGEGGGGLPVVEGGTAGHACFEEVAGGNEAGG